MGKASWRAMMVLGAMVGSGLLGGCQQPAPAPEVARDADTAELARIARLEDLRSEPATLMEILAGGDPVERGQPAPLYAGANPGPD